MLEDVFKPFVTSVTDKQFFAKYQWVFVCVATFDL